MGRIAGTLREKSYGNQQPSFRLTTKEGSETN